MKKPTALFLALTLTLSLTACNNETPPNPTPDTPPQTLSDTDITPTPEATPNQEIPTPTTTPVTTQSTPTPTETTPTPVPIPENFNVIDYIPPFDPVTPALFTLFEYDDYHITDETAEKAAIAAYKSSFYYENALEDIKFLFHNENGVLTPNMEGRGSLFLETYQYFVSPEFEITPYIAQCFKGKFDGLNEEYLLLLTVPLPPDCLSWSGTSIFHIPVYVNGKGEAFILDDVCSQDHAGFTCVYYNNSGVIHAIFDYGHNMGGGRGVVYSFAEGSPKAELRLYAPIWITEDLKEKGVFLCAGWGFYAPFFWNEEDKEYCAVKGEEPDIELKEIVCTNKAVLEVERHAAENIENTKLWIVGGKYISFSFSSFVYENGGFKEYIGLLPNGRDDPLEAALNIVPTNLVYDEADEWEIIFKKAYNIDLR